MATLKELIAKKSALEKQIAEARHREIKEAIASVRAVVAEFDLSVNDVFPKRKEKSAPKRRAAKAPPAPPKYRDPASGQTWTGRGRAPKWIIGKDRAEFEIR